MTRPTAEVRQQMAFLRFLAVSFDPPGVCLPTNYCGRAEQQRATVHGKNLTGGASVSSSTVTGPTRTPSTDSALNIVSKNLLSAQSFSSPLRKRFVRFVPPPSRDQSSALRHARGAGYCSFLSRHSETRVNCVSHDGGRCPELVGWLVDRHVLLPACLSVCLSVCDSALLLQSTASKPHIHTPRIVGTRADPSVSSWSSIPLAFLPSVVRLVLDLTELATRYLVLVS